MQNLWQFKSLCPCQKKTLSKDKVFFNEINPLRDLWNCLRQWNMASPCEIPAGVSGFISFHLMRQHQILQFTKWIISHLPQGKYFIQKKLELRLCGNRKMVTAEPFYSILAQFNERSLGCAFFKKGVQTVIGYSLYIIAADKLEWNICIDLL